MQIHPIAYGSVSLKQTLGQELHSKEFILEMLTGNLGSGEANQRIKETRTESYPGPLELNNGILIKQNSLNDKK